MAALILSPHSDNLGSKLFLASQNAELFYFAIISSDDQRVLELLQGGVPPNSDYYTREKDGYTPLHKACAGNHLHIAEMLIKFGAIVAATTNYGWTPLHRACLYNSKATAKLLLEHHCPTGEPEC